MQSKQSARSPRRSAAIALLAALIAAPFNSSAQDATAAQAGNAEAGRLVYERCRSCHEIGRRARHKMGPHLNGIFGRAAGQLEGYAFSLPMISAGLQGLIWNETSLNAFLTDPAAVVPHTGMPLIGVPDAGERADLIAYIRAASIPTETTQALAPRE